MKHLKLTLLLLTAATLTQLEANIPSEKICYEDVVVAPYEKVSTSPVTIQGLVFPAKVQVLGRGTLVLNGTVMKEKTYYVSNGDRVQVVLKADHRNDAKVRTTIVFGDTFDVFTLTTKHGEISKNNQIDLRCTTNTFLK